MVLPVGAFLGMLCAAQLAAAEALQLTAPPLDARYELTVAQYGGSVREILRLDRHSGQVDRLGRVARGDGEFARGWIRVTVEGLVPQPPPFTTQPRFMLIGDLPPGILLFDTLTGLSWRAEYRPSTAERRLRVPYRFVPVWRGSVAEGGELSSDSSHGSPHGNGARLAAEYFNQIRSRHAPAQVAAPAH